MLGGCGKTSSPAPANAPAPKPDLHIGPLTDYVPAAGLRWMVVGKPRALAESPAFQGAVALLFPNERLDAFASATGIDLRRSENAVIAGFDLGTVYLVESQPKTLPIIVDRFRARLAGSERVQEPTAGILRVSGMAGATPELLVRVDDSFVAVAVGDPTLGRVAEAFARKQLRTSAPALRGAALSTLPPAMNSALAMFYAPGPFASEWAGAVGGLLSQALAVSATLSAAGPGRARISLYFSGDFGAAGADRLSAAFEQLSDSSIGKLLALDQRDTPPVVHEREQGLSLEVELAVAPIAEGLRAAVMADVWEILRLRAPAANQ